MVELTENDKRDHKRRQLARQRRGRLVQKKRELVAEQSTPGESSAILAVVIPQFGVLVWIVLLGMSLAGLFSSYEPYLRNNLTLLIFSIIGLFLIGGGFAWHALLVARYPKKWLPLVLWVEVFWIGALTWPLGLVYAFPVLLLLVVKTCLSRA